MFWKPAHARLALALAGLALTRRRVAGVPASAALAVPWLWSEGRAHGVGALPARLVVDLGEIAVALRGALRYRTPFL
jgi:hypothetical protein